MNTTLQQSANVFDSVASTPSEVESAGEKALVAMQQCTAAEHGVAVKSMAQNVHWHVVSVVDLLAQIQALWLLRKKILILNRDLQ